MIQFHDTCRSWYAHQPFLRGSSRRLVIDIPEISILTVRRVKRLHNTLSYTNDTPKSNPEKMEPFQLENTFSETRGGGMIPACSNPRRQNTRQKRTPSSRRRVFPIRGILTPSLTKIPNSLANFMRKNRKVLVIAVG